MLQLRMIQMIQFLFFSKHDRVKIKLSDNTSVLDFLELYLTEELKIHVVNETNWYAKQF